MRIARGTLLAKLNEATIGLSSKEILEQSNSFVFKEGYLYAFNDEILARVKSPLDFDMAVSASEFLGVLSKMPDDEVDVILKGGEVVIKGVRRKARINCTTQIHLPVSAVPRPEKWHKLQDGAMPALQAASQACGHDETQYLTTVVHVTPDYVEACDNNRLIRVKVQSGFPAEVLIPASSVSKLEGLEVAKVAMGEGWVHFKTTTGAEISARCSHEKYHQGVEALFKMENPESIVLPANLAEMVERAEVFNTASYDSRITVELADGEMKITSRKETGSYEEDKRVAYKGRALSFEVHPKFLVDMMKRTREVKVDGKKMKVNYDRIQFVVSLIATGEKSGKPSSEE